MTALLTPAWLILTVPVLLLLYYMRPNGKILYGLRTALLMLVILAMTEPVIKVKGNSGDIIILADRSASMSAEHLQNQKEIVDLINKAKSSDGRTAVISFGEKAVVEHPLQSSSFAGFSTDPGSSQSNFDKALELALSTVPKERPSRILVLSDGVFTGPDPSLSAAKAAARDVGIDFRHMQKASVNDLSIEKVSAPIDPAPGEAYMITAWVNSPVSQQISYELKRNGETCISRGKKEVKAGRTRLIFRDKSGKSGTRAYKLTVKGEGSDPLPANNQAKILVQTKGRKPVLFITDRPAGALQQILIKAGINVTVKKPSQVRWLLEELSGYSAVLIENVPARMIRPTGMGIIRSWVETGCGGMMMTGGKNSFGPGGYFRSPLEEILPVTMELREEHRKFQLAIVIAMDRSGSMAASAGGGKTKMDLANIGAVQVLDLLSDNDELGVTAVDSQPHTVVHIGKVSDVKKKRKKILTVESMGGGIFVYEALTHAASMLMKAESDTKHIILFSDAADSEEPGDYKDLLTKCRAAGITCSVIALGTPRDCDAKLLQDIAEKGGGQCLFSDNAAEIPRLFAQDTFAITRSAMVEEPATIGFTGEFAALAGFFPDSTPVAGGYNLCYIRPEASLLAVTKDEFSAPFCASWHAGNGRVAAYTGEVDGKYTGSIGKWPHLGRTLGSLAAWTAGIGTDLPPEMMLVQNVQNGICSIRLYLDPSRETESFSGDVHAVVLRGKPGLPPDKSRVIFDWESADVLSVSLPISGDETLLPVVYIPGQDPVDMAPTCLPYSPEYRPAKPGEGLRNLRTLAQSTGGTERMDVTTIWESVKPVYVSFRLAPWLYSLAAIIFILEILHRRTSALESLKRVKMPKMDLSRTKPAHPVKKKKTKAPEQKNEPDKTDIQKEPPSPAPKDHAEESTLTAMQKARARARKRNR